MFRATTMAFCVLTLALACGGCAALGAGGCAPGETRLVADLVYFGTARPGGTVSRKEWTDFLRTSVTPRFPDGLTVWEATGQWRAGDGTLLREPSFVLNLVHADDATSEASVSALRDEYKSRFHQESTLRVKQWACVSF
jgi:hypothetical protein